MEIEVTPRMISGPGRRAGHLVLCQEAEKVLKWLKHLFGEVAAENNVCHSDGPWNAEQERVFAVQGMGIRSAQRRTNLL